LFDAVLQFLSKPPARPRVETPFAATDSELFCWTQQMSFMPAAPAGLPHGLRLVPGFAGDKRKPAHLPAFFSFLAARFSLSDFSGFFFSVFFWSMPLLMSRSALVVAGKA
jgi:hypothetical protein